MQTQFSENNGPVLPDELTFDLSQTELHHNGKLTPSLVETHAKQTATQDRDSKQQLRVSAMSTSAFLMSFGRSIFSARIPVLLGKTLRGRGIDSEERQRLLATLFCPSDSGRVALALSISGTGCSCSVK